MLYDPKWDKTTEPKANPEFAGVRLSAFIAWLETMPPDKMYEFTDSRNCAVWQHLKSRGLPNAECDIGFGCTPGQPGYWLNEIVVEHPWSFGAALERARAYQASL